MGNYYEMLGVRAGAHPAEIDLAYKTMLQVPNLDAEAQIELGMAYNTLLHPLRRPEYDKTLYAKVQQPATAHQYNRTESVVIHRHEHQYQRTNNPLTGFVVWYMMAFGVTTLIGLVALLF